MKKQKLILVLSGGGAKGAFQIGALKYIFENGLNIGKKHIPGHEVKFDYIAGISAGSLNAVMVAMNKFPELVKLWEEEIAGHPERIWTSDFVEVLNGKLQARKGALQKFLPKVKLKNFFRLFTKKGRSKLGKEVIDKIVDIEAFASNEPLQQRLEELIDLKEIKDTLLRVGYVSLDTGEYHTVRHSDFKDSQQLSKAVLASAAMPVIWKPVDNVASKDENGNLRKHHNLVDGGIRNVSPLGDIIKDINERNESDTDYFVVIINNHSGALEAKKRPKQNFLNVAYRALVDITLNEIFINDIREFTRINDLVLAFEKAQKDALLGCDFDFTNPRNGKKYRKFYYEIIQPEGFIGTTLDFSKEQITSRLEKGYEEAKKAFNPNINNSLETLSSSSKAVAAMDNPHSFLRYNEGIVV